MQPAEVLRPRLKCRAGLGHLRLNEHRQLVKIGEFDARKTNAELAQQFQ